MGAKLLVEGRASSVFCFFLFFFIFLFIAPFTIHHSPIHLLQKDMIYLKEVTAIAARLFTIIVIDKDQKMRGS